MIKNIVELETIFILLVSTNCCICNLKYSVTKDILVVFHNGSNYDYHFIIKELTKEIEGKVQEKMMKNTKNFFSFNNKRT